MNCLECHTEFNVNRFRLTAIVRCPHCGACHKENSVVTKKGKPFIVVSTYLLLFMFGAEFTELLEGGFGVYIGKAVSYSIAIPLLIWVTFRFGDKYGTPTYELHPLHGSSLTRLDGKIVGYIIIVLVVLVFLLLQFPHPGSSS